MTEILLVIFSLALVVGGIVEFRRGERVFGTVFGLLGLFGLGYLAYSLAEDITLPEVTISFNWTLISFVLAVTTVVVGLCKEWPGVTAIGFGFGVWFLYLGLVPSVWFLILGLLAAVLLVISTGTGSSWIAALAAISLVASSVFAFYTIANDTVTQLRAALVAQLAENNKQFASYEQLCLAAQPGSETALLCGAINQNTSDIADLKVKVDANTTAIATLTGQMATVTEKADDQQITIQSNPSSDDTAAAALAKELAAAGWGPDDININNIDESIKSDQPGGNTYGDRIRTKSKLVEVLNGSSPEQTAIRDRVTSAVPESERARLLSGEGYYAVQFKRPVCLGGSDYFKDGVAHHGDGEKVCYDTGDVSWVYVASDGTVYWGASVRDDCNNPHYDTSPAPQGSPQAEVCPEETARAGQMIGSGCNPGQPETPTGGTPESSTPGTTPGGSTPTTSTPTTGSTTPTTSTPTTTPTTTTESCPPGEHPNPPGVGGCGKDDLSPRNSDHTTAASPPGEPETEPVHPSETADPATTPGAPATELAPDATPTPTQTAEAPSAGAGNETTSPATGDVDPDSQH